ncbi:hypothetical protein AP285_24780 [Limnospira platensis YZ]|nr:hypothetical protein AP285_24780 [Arthrospira platensis YZ]KDR55301.1 hypothetical protein APPUASWS_023290 [Arthrospira platensis str. Paraca]
MNLDGQKKNFSGGAIALFFEKPLSFWGESVLHYNIMGIVAKIIFLVASDYVTYPYDTPLQPPCQPLFTWAAGPKKNFFWGCDRSFF